MNEGGGGSAKSRSDLRGTRAACRTAFGSGAAPASRFISLPVSISCLFLNLLSGQRLYPCSKFILIMKDFLLVSGRKLTTTIH